MRKNLKKIHEEKKKKAFTKECPLGVLFNTADKTFYDISRNIKHKCEDVEEKFHTWLYEVVFLEKYKYLFRRFLLIVFGYRFFVPAMPFGKK